MKFKEVDKGYLVMTWAFFFIGSVLIIPSLMGMGCKTKGNVWTWEVIALLYPFLSFVMMMVRRLLVHT